MPFFAFAESPAGYLLALDTRSECVMLLDITGAKGPWIAAESFDDFFSRLSESGSAAAPASSSSAAAAGGAQQLELEAEEDGDSHMGEDAEEGEEEEDEEGDVFACDRCMDELPASAVRFHCNTCENYDLCSKCKTKADSAAAAGSSAAPKKKAGRSAPPEVGADAHPTSHTFTKIEAAAAAEEDDEEEEKN